jgi:hypothetical protein
MSSCSNWETAEMNARKMRTKPTFDQSRYETDVGGEGFIDFLGGVYNSIEREMCMKL